jgi:hypothetical protein
MDSWSLEGGSALCPLPYASSKEQMRWGGPLAAPVASPAYPPLHELCIEKSDIEHPHEVVDAGICQLNGSTKPQIS